MSEDKCENSALNLLKNRAGPIMRSFNFHFTNAHIWGWQTAVVKGTMKHACFNVFFLKPVRYCSGS